MGAKPEGRSYTFNGALSDKLGEVASVTFVSSFPVNVVLSSVIAPLYYAQQFNEQATLEAYRTPPLDIGTRNEARLTFMATGATPDDETVRPEPVKGPFMVRQAHHERDCFTQMFHVSR